MISTLILATILSCNDGDTCRAIIDDQQEIIRLALIDAPESKQHYGHAATIYLRNLVVNKQVELDIIAVDRYGRIVARILMDGIDVNRSLVLAGLAYPYHKYLPAAWREQIIDARRYAARNRLGVWSGKPVMPGWDWRRFRKYDFCPELLQSAAKCSAMAHCEEAQTALVCGADYLDRDDDSIACERLCK